MNNKSVYAGIVKWFNYNKGYGFVEVLGQEDVFLHHSVVVNKETPEEGDKVYVQLESGPKGPQATYCKKIK